MKFAEPTSSAAPGEKTSAARSAWTASRFGSCVPALVLMLCGSVSEAGPSARPTRREIESRAAAQFETAVLYKPVEPAARDLVFTLAPMILQEARTNSGALPDDRIASFSLSNGIARLNPAEAAVYYAQDTVEVNGRSYARFSYEWWYAPAKSANLRKSQAQGVRITLGSDGLPVLWEVLRDSTGYHLLFAANSLEAKAREQLGPSPLKDKSALASALRLDRQTLVARVIEDGPMAMGPMVYMQSATHSAQTLICRCMPPQTRNLKETRTYVLKPKSDLLQARLPGNAVLPAWPKRESPLIGLSGF